MTVPPAAVDRIAPPSQPGTSTQTTVTSTGPPVAATASRSPIGSRASASTTWSASPLSRSRAASASWGTTPTVRVAPASRAAARLSEPDLPAPPITSTDGASYRSTTRRVSAGAPQTSITARLSAGGRSSGITAAIERPKRMAYPSAGTCSPCPSQRSRPSSITSGVRRQRDQGRDPVADCEAERRLGPDLLHGADQHAARAGHGVLHLPALGDDRQHLAAYGVAVHHVVVGVLALELAERRGVEVEGLDPDPHLVGPQLAPGVEAERCLRQVPTLRRVVADAVQAGGIARAPRGRIGAQRRHSRGILR